MRRTVHYISVLIIFSICIMWVILIHPHFGVLDDISGIEKLQQIDSSKTFHDIWNLVYEKESGRFRPGYWFYKYFIYKIVGINGLGFYIFHTLNLICVFLLLFFLTKLIIRNDFLSFLSPLLLFSSNTIMENYSTLGKQEPMILLFGLATLYLFFLFDRKLSEQKFSSISKRKFILGNCLLVFLIICFYGVKETACIYFPLSIIWFFIIISKPHNEFKQQNLKYSAAFVLLNLIVLIGFTILKPKAVGYAAKYSINITSMELVLVRYYERVLIDLLYFWVCLFYWIVMIFINIVFKKQQGQRLIHQIFFLAFFCGFLAVYLPWPAAMPKYIVMSIIGSVIFSLSVLADIKNYIKQMYRTQAFYKILLLRILFFLILALMFLNMFYGIRDSYSEVKVRNLWDRVNAWMMHYISMNASPNSTVFLFCDDVESSFSISNSPKVLYDRDDIKIKSWATEIKPEEWSKKETFSKIFDDLKNIEENDLLCVPWANCGITEYIRIPLNLQASYVFHNCIKKVLKGQLEHINSIKLSTEYYPIRIYNDKVERRPFSIIKKKFVYEWDIYKMNKIYRVHNNPEIKFRHQLKPEEFLYKFEFFNFHPKEDSFVKLALNVFSNFLEDFSGKSLNIFINGRHFNSQIVQFNQKIYLISIPQKLVLNNVNNIVLTLTEKEETSYVDNVDISIKSHSFSKKPFDSISIMGYKIEPAINPSGQLRGIQLVIYDKDKKIVLHSQRYDTFQSFQDANSLNNVIKNGPIGAYYIMTVFDDGTYSLTPALLDTFRKMGIKTNLRQHFRCGFGYIGVKKDSNEYKVMACEVSDNDIVDISYPDLINSEKYFEDIIMTP